MRFSQLQRNEETKAVELRFGEDTLHITVYPHRRSIGWQRKIKQAIDNNDVGAIADLFFTTLQSWDLTDDDGNVLPFTEDVIDGFGLETFGEVNTKLNEALNPNRETSN